MDRYLKFHLFAGKFASEEEARAYSLPQWEPEPDSDVSDAEYRAWELRNPSWKLAEDLGVPLEEDFVQVSRQIETVVHETRNDELHKLSKLKPFDTFILVFADAYDCSDAHFEKIARTLSSVVYVGMVNG